jgi:hypothetical protein
MTEGNAGSVAGATAHDQSAWTPDLVLTHVLALLGSSDRRHEQRFTDQDKAVQAALVAQEKAVSAALDAAQRAVLKAEVAAERRFESVNEFRGQLADQAATLLPRTEADARFAALTEKFDGLYMALGEKIDANTRYIDRAGGKTTGLDAAWGYVIGAAGLVGAVVAIVFALAK